MLKCMTYGLFRLVTLVILISPVQVTMAQLDHMAYRYKYDTDQTIQPIFQGWSKNEDGTFDMHFGYLNRNYSKELHIPIGPDNMIDMAGLDNIQNQPTYFQTRANRDIFTVTVPADFGNREIRWRLTTEGQTLQAFGWLQAEWEITGLKNELDPSEMRFDGGPAVINLPPELSVVSATSVRLPDKLTLTTSVTDDGLPEPEPEQEKIIPNAWNSTPLLTRPEGAIPIPTNVPHLNTNLRGAKLKPMAPRGKLTVSYMVWRGPANIITDSMFSEVVNGSAITEITFTEPGEYQLRVQASDGRESVYEFVTVKVQ